MNIGCYFALRVSECMNPIIYNVSSKRMADASTRVLRYIRYISQCILRLNIVASKVRNCRNGCRPAAELEFENERNGRRKQNTDAATVGQSGTRQGCDDNRRNVAAVSSSVLWMYFINKLNHKASVKIALNLYQYTYIDISEQYYCFQLTEIVVSCCHCFCDFLSLHG